VSAATVSTLVSAFLRSGKSIALPIFEGKRGHPVLFGWPVFEELLNAPDSLGARSVVRADPSRVVEVAVSDSAVVEDIDTPEAYQELCRRFGA
jgi:molybdenum cofactor cytidylyltransferase